MVLLDINSEEFGKLDKGTKDLVLYKQGLASDFRRKLFHVIERADDGNLELLARGFPLHVRAFKNYAFVTGWWRELTGKLGLEY